MEMKIQTAMIDAFQAHDQFAFGQSPAHPRETCHAPDGRAHKSTATPLDRY